MHCTYEAATQAATTQLSLCDLIAEYKAGRKTRSSLARSAHGWLDSARYDNKPSRVKILAR